MSIIFGQFKNFKASTRKPLFRLFGLFPHEDSVGGYSFNHIPELAAELRSLPLLSGVQDGSNVEFGVRRVNPILTWNGVILTEDMDFTVTSTLLGVTVTFIVAPTSDVILRELHTTGVEVTHLSSDGSGTPYSWADGTLLGTIDGSNDTFQMGQSHTRVAVYLNGDRLSPTYFSHSGASITFLPPYVPQVGNELFVEGW